MATTHPSDAETTAVVCPPWCIEHTPADEHLGNPDNKYDHQGPSGTFTDSGGGEVTVDLSALLEASGAAVDDFGPAIWIGGHAFPIDAARPLAAFLLSLVELAEAKRP